MAKQLRLGRTKGVRGPRRKFPDDPLIPIRGDRLQAALRRDRLTLAAFARDNGLTQQTALPERNSKLTPASRRAFTLR